MVKQWTYQFPGGMIAGTVEATTQAKARALIRDRHAIPFLPNGATVTCSGTYHPVTVQLDRASAIALALSVKAGDQFKPLGSKFPVPFMVVRVNPVKPVFTLRERIGEAWFERTARLSVLAHMLRVSGVAS